MWSPFFGWYASKARMIVVDRAGQASALRKMVAEAKLRFADGRQLVIFPEGTRGEPGVPRDYNPGIAAPYTALAVAVHPVAPNAAVPWHTPVSPRTHRHTFLHDTYYKPP